MTETEDRESSRPVPDPTSLTTEQLLREVDRVEQLFKAQINSLEGIFGEKIEMHDRQFELVEQQRVEQKSDTKAAVDAALTAQKEAVSGQTTASERSIAKSEAATKKSIEQLGSMFTTAFEGQRRDIDDLKERITTVEQVKIGGKEVILERGTSLAHLVGLIGSVIGVLTLIVAVVAIIATQ